MMAVSKKASTWLQDMKEEILERLDANDFISVEKLAALVLKVQGAISNGHAKGSWKCVICRKTFKSRSSLREHIKDRHQEAKCKVCGKTFKSSGGLAAHLRTDRNPHKGIDQ
jgi:C2H2 type zinc finger protein/zinc finger double-stranded RNA-binding protein